MKSKRLATRAEAARALNIPVRSLDRLVEKGAPVEPGAGRRYSIPALRAWRAARTASQATVADLTLQRAKLAAAQRRLATLRYRRERGELLRRADVVAEGQGVMRVLRARLLALPRAAVQAGGVPLELEPVLRRIVVEALRELARWRPTEGAHGDPAVERAETSEAAS